MEYFNKPTGSGKTEFLKSIQSMTSKNVIFINFNDILNNNYNDSIVYIKNLFTYLMLKNNLIIIFDSFENYFNKQNNDKIENMLKHEIINFLDISKSQNILVFISMINPWNLDKKLFSRIDKSFFISIPSFEAKIDIIKEITIKNKIELSIGEIDAISSTIQGYTYQNINNLFSSLIYQTILNNTKITYKLIKSYIKNSNSSTSNSSMKDFIKYIKINGDLESLKEIEDCYFKKNNYII